jgi:hypothetical protein
MLQGVGFNLPEELRAAAEFTIMRRLEREIYKFEQQNDREAFRVALKIANEVARLGYRLDRTSMSRKFENLIVATVRAAISEPSTENHEAALTLIDLANKLSLHANLERAQEIVYEALQRDRALGAHLEALALKLGLAPSLLHDTPPASETTLAANEMNAAAPHAEPRAEESVLS